MTRKLALMMAACVSLVPSASADIFGTGANQFTVDFVNISGATNPASGDRYGIVNNDYRMGAFEITNDQWDKFTASLGVPVTGDPWHAYALAPYWTGTNIPTNNVSWLEAAQFVNWLNTSTGHQAAYTFTGTQGTSGYKLAPPTMYWKDNKVAFLYRNKDAFYYLPTVDEWVKAAYYKGGDTTLQDYSNASPGDLVGGIPDSAKWNYAPSGVGQPWNVGSGIEELNGTYDMMGNVSEWTESPLIPSNPTIRRTGGGAYDNSNPWSGRQYWCPGDYEYTSIGFRVASDVPAAVVPEPSALALVALGLLGISRRRK